MLIEMKDYRDNEISNEIFCITGGTGSFGKKMINRLLCSETREIGNSE